MAMIVSPSGADTVGPFAILICLLGSFRVLKGGRPVALRSGGKGEALLAELAMRPGLGVTREYLLDAIWPERHASLAAQSLNSLVYSLQKSLGGEVESQAPILLQDGHYRLNGEAGIGIDVVEFDALVATGEREERRGNAAGAVERFGLAVDLYRGEFCTGTGVAAMIERERLHATYLSLLARLADYEFDGGRYRSCLENAHRLLANDPCREDAHRVAMRCYVRLGERSQAFRQFRLCQSILRAEFDAEPERATVMLHERIRLDPAGV
jgi:DNA-binding SARP family transcriptional activator